MFFQTTSLLWIMKNTEILNLQRCWKRAEKVEHCRKKKQKKNLKSVELISKNSFYRDWDDLKSKSLNRAIQDISMRIKQVHSITQIPRMKQLRCSQYEYKIELHVFTKIYWILCDVSGNKIIFTRIKSESWCKKNL